MNKKKIAKRKTQKRGGRKPQRAAKTTHELIVKVQATTTPTTRDLEPLKEGGKYMIPKTWLSERQVLRMLQKTPPQHVYTREGKGGGRFSYVTGLYVEKVLNYVFGWNWDFEIISHGREEDQVWVLGRLTVKDGAGRQIVKTQFGRADVKRMRESKKLMDFGNDLKAAATDSLKKCASLLGIASDVYGKSEFKHEANVDLKENGTVVTPPALPIHKSSSAVPNPKSSPTGEPRCAVCDELLVPEVVAYSKKMFGKYLCRAHQK